MNDKQIETMVRQLIEEHLADDAVELALDWLDKRVLAYQEMQEIGLLDAKEEKRDAYLIFIIGHLSIRPSVLVSSNESTV